MVWWSEAQTTVPLKVPYPLSPCASCSVHTHTHIALEPANLPVLQCFCSEINISAVTCSYVIDKLLFMK